MNVDSMLRGLAIHIRGTSTIFKLIQGSINTNSLSKPTTSALQKQAGNANNIQLPR
jgi:hypothetical protein